MLLTSDEQFIKDPSMKDKKSNQKLDQHLSNSDGLREGDSGVQKTKNQKPKARLENSFIQESSGQINDFSKTKIR